MIVVAGEVVLTDGEVDTIRAALSSELRYCQRNLDRAREDDAVERWARRCISVGALIRKLKGEEDDDQ